MVGRLIDIVKKVIVLKDMIIQVMAMCGGNKGSVTVMGMSMGIKEQEAITTRGQRPGGHTQWAL
jgi:hypothetical protein